MNVIEGIKGGLIVSCQALKDEPLHSPFIMSRMAYAAMLGGAAGIRANSAEDITEIKKVVSLPVIGIVKKDYPDCPVYITPTMEEINSLVACGCEIIAMDATPRPRPKGQTIEQLFSMARETYPNQLFMADCSTYQEGMQAAAMGFDIIGTTLSGYTEDSQGAPSPNYHMMLGLVYNSDKPVIAEGGIWSPEQLAHAKNCGVHAAVVGSAITRPMLITQKYADIMNDKQ